MTLERTARREVICHVAETEGIPVRLAPWGPRSCVYPQLRVAEEGRTEAEHRPGNEQTERSRSGKNR